ncbi:P-loop containing nucleoside triphosphate hydrolase protein, partial [Lasiosphaeria hispida]
DLVQSKEQGLIILLHGPPGSGKTSTAETIAAYTWRPLYSLTCGDLGSGSTESETLLDRHASRAEKWGRVLLLDEADVFLLQRDWTEVSRNALVSVFLRQLEYYSGILFLTTNRPRTMDEAFKSRIHISLRYPSIDLASTEQLWANIIRRLETENEWVEIKIKFDRNRLLAFAEKHYKRREQTGTTWNGRQIRNAFQTALAQGHAGRKLSHCNNFHRLAVKETTNPLSPPLGTNKPYPSSRPISKSQASPPSKPPQAATARSGCASN